MQFLADHAPGSVFAANPERALVSERFDIAINAIAAQLEEWATYQDSGLANFKPFEIRFRIEAATDLLEQVQ